MTRMLVLSALTAPGGFSHEVHRRFTGSLFETGFAGDIVIVTSYEEKNDEDIALLQKHYNRLAYHGIPELNNHRDINCYRYRYFYQYLKSRINNYDYVMLSDARDVVFQRDLSEYPFPEGVDLFFAEEEKRIGECGINSGWILDLYGEECLTSLKNKMVLCSGTTIGSPDAILSYLEVMIKEVDRVDKAFHERFSSLGGIDQGIHNYIYYKKILPNLVIRTMPNSSNLIYTVGHVAADDSTRPFLDSDSRFINEQGELCYCVHQYDRLQSSIRETFNQNSVFKI